MTATRPPISLTVRAVRESDSGPLAQIYLAARRQAFHWVPPDRFTLADYEESVLEEEVWVASGPAARPLGFVSVYLPEAFIHNLFVAPEHQGRGIGGILIDHVTARLDRPVRLKCLSKNLPARAFYERRGWTIEEEGDGYLGAYILYRFDR